MNARENLFSAISRLPEAGSLGPEELRGLRLEAEGSNLLHITLEGLRFDVKLLHREEVGHPLDLEVGFELSVYNDSPRGEFFLRRERQRLLIMDYTGILYRRARLYSPTALTGSPPPLLPYVERFARFLHHLAEILGEGAPMAKTARAAREALLALRALLQERGSERGFFAGGPFRLLRTSRGVALYNAELHPLGPLLDALLRGETGWIPLPGHPGLRLKAELLKSSPGSLKLRPLALEVGPLVVSPRKREKPYEAFETSPKDILYTSFGVDSDDLDLLKKKGPEALARVLATRRLAEA